jgi:hypothetical protein
MGHTAMVSRLGRVEPTGRVIVKSFDSYLDSYLGTILTFQSHQLDQLEINYGSALAITLNRCRQA